MSLLGSVDGALDRVFGSLRGRPAADRIFYLASAVGDHSLVWLALGGLRALGGRRGRVAAARLGLALALESALVNGAVKSLFRRPRPVWTGGHPLHLRRPRTSSFPSGHASSAACAVVLLGEGDRLWPLYAVLAVVVAASRVHVRIHHASDALAGAALGAALGVLVRRLFPLDRLDPAGIPAGRATLSGT